MNKEFLPDMKNFEMHSEELLARTGAFDARLKELPIPDDKKRLIEELYTQLMCSVAASGFIAGYRYAQKLE